MSTTTNPPRLTTKAVRKVLTAAGITSGVVIERACPGEVRVTVDVIDLETDENEAPTDREATEVLKDKVREALSAAGWSFGGFRCGWGAWELSSNYRSSNPHGLDGFADPMHY